LEHWHRELCKFRDFLQERFHTTITEAGLREAIGLMNRERRLRRNLAATMQRDCPPLTGRQLIELKSSISGIAADLEQYQRALNEMAATNRPCRSECSEQARVARSERVRVLLTGVPLAHGAERVLDIVEQCGGLVVCQENCTGLKPILEDVDPEAPDPMQALAEKYFRLPCSVMTPNDRRLENLRTLAAEYRPECVVELVWQACLTYDVESQRVRQLAEGELGVRYLRIETDYGPSDSARISVRVEALLETVRAGRPADTCRGR
jgi:benzoyl-CoA reductase/2-hydroxyglutaryl-CoA dehydratase subunit BcrC/BadD/HgdB